MKDSSCPRARYITCSLDVAVPGYAIQANQMEYHGTMNSTCLGKWKRFSALMCRHTMNNLMWLSTFPPDFSEWRQDYQRRVNKTFDQKAGLISIQHRTYGFDGPTDLLMPNFHR